MISLNCVSSVYCMSLLLIVFIVAPMQQHTVESKDHKHTNLPRRETPRSPWETPWCCSSTRCRSWDLGRSEGNGKAVEEYESFGDEGLARVHGVTITTTSPHTSRNRSAAPWRWTAGSARGSDVCRWTPNTMGHDQHTPALAGGIKTGLSVRAGILRGKWGECILVYTADIVIVTLDPKTSHNGQFFFIYGDVFIIWKRSK